MTTKKAIGTSFAAIIILIIVQIIAQLIANVGYFTGWVYNSCWNSADYD